MRSLLWFALGLTGGFIAAHYINKDPRGHEVLAEVDARISQFADRIADAYREQEARIVGLVEDAATSGAAAAESAMDAATDAAASVADAAKKLTD